MADIAGPGDQIPADQISVVDRGAPDVSNPPAAKTRPSRSAVSVWWARGVAMEADADQVEVAGSNTSTESVTAVPIQAPPESRVPPLE